MTDERMPSMAGLIGGGSWTDGASWGYGESDSWSRPWPDEAPRLDVPPVREALVAALPERPAETVEALERPWMDAPSHRIVDFARQVCRFDPSPVQAALLSDIYGRDIRIPLLRIGRRGGKGRTSALVATFEATVNADAHLAAVPAGEQVAVVVLATSQHQARIVHRYIRTYLQSPDLAPLVVRDVEDEIELANGIVIVTLPCSARSARGLAIAVAILDEAAWFVGVDGSPMEVGEIWKAIYPGTAQFPQGKALVLSTPRWSTGWFADQCREAASGADPEMAHYWATTAEMNPRIPQSFLDAERAKDPVSFRREYEAAFDSGIGAVFDEATVRAAVVERAEQVMPDGRYIVAIDPAYTGDRFALIAGRMRGDKLVVSRVSGWQGSKARPLDHRGVLDQVAEIARAYNRAPVLLDQFAAEPIAQGLAERGVHAIRKPWRNDLKVDAVTALRQLLYQGRVELPRSPELVSELVSLEQRPLPSGRPRIAAPPGGHDDYAHALLALAHHSTSRSGWGSGEGEAALIA